jgi:multimeric flavodoxin WrbA
MSKHKNIVILTGSPRKDGNSNALVNAFSTSLIKQGHEVFTYDCAVNEHKGCIGCETCFKIPSQPCSQDPQYTLIANKLIQADVLVFATPLYFFSFTSQLKKVIDQIYCLYKSPVKSKIKEAYLIAIGNTDDINDFIPIQQQYKHIIDLYNWHNLGVFFATDLGKRGDVSQTNYLTKISKIGEDLLNG